MTDIRELNLKIVIQYCTGTDVHLQYNINII